MIGAGGGANSIFKTFSFLFKAHTQFEKPHNAVRLLRKPSLLPMNPSPQRPALSIILTVTFWHFPSFFSVNMLSPNLFFQLGNIYKVPEHSTHRKQRYT